MGDRPKRAQRVRLTRTSPGSGPVAVGVFAVSPWQFTSGVLADGNHAFSTDTEDAAGNVSAGAGLLVTIDTVAPGESLPDLAPASDSGASISDNVTNKTTFTLQGTALESLEIFLYLWNCGGGVCQIGTFNGSSWFSTQTELDGVYEYGTRTRDLAGNLSNGTGPVLAVTVDTAPPGAPGAPDLTTSSDTGTVTTDNVSSDRTPTLRGFLAAGGVIIVLDGATTLGRATAGSGGAWAFTTATRTYGVHNFRARAVDAAGNQSALSPLLKVTIGAVCLGEPSTKTGTAAGQTINGTAGNDVISSLGGNDTVNGKGGADRICGGGGSDTLNGGGGNDSLDGGPGGGDSCTGGPAPIRLRRRAKPGSHRWPTAT